MENVGTPGEDCELFNVSSDMTETRDIFYEYPDKVEEMNKAWQAWLKN